MRVTFLLGVAALLAGCVTTPPPAPAGPSSSPPQLAAPAQERSPSKEPPGAFFADVTHANITTTICVPGWTATVRRSTSFTLALTRTMMIRAGLDPKNAIKYELDHFVPLAIGGHPRSEDNLWLQSWDGDWNARVKDRLERRLQVMVCAGQITLQSARQAVQSDWHAAYRQYVPSDARPAPRGMDIEEEEVVE
jgi:hypothetical protein